MKELFEIEEMLSKLRGAKVAVLGLGISNMPVVEFLIDLGADVTACDIKSKQQLGDKYKKLMKMGVSFQLESDCMANLGQFDWLVRTPGMRPDVPEIAKAVDQGAQLTSEIELVFNLCPCNIIGITGSDGKTTTTSLVAEILREEGLTVHLGGNIGQPLIKDVLSYEESDVVVLELSSFQLMSMKQSPEFSLITNISPNHLDYHLSYHEYIDAKFNVFRHQTQEQQLVLNWDNAITKGAGETAAAKVWFFSRLQSLKQGAYVKDNKIAIADGDIETPICCLNDIQLLGRHNIENVLAATMLGYAVGASAGAIKRAITSFNGVEHRLEKVAEVAGVTFYNDSIASSPTRAIAGLKAFNRPIILIAGGSDKYVPFDQFAKEVVKQAKAIIVLGATAGKIRNAIEQELCCCESKLPIIDVSSLDEAVKQASSMAKPGDIVLLSPACASFDMFKNFEERGLLFKQYVRELTH